MFYGARVYDDMCYELESDAFLTKGRLKNRDSELNVEKKKNWKHVVRWCLCFCCILLVYIMNTQSYAERKNNPKSDPSALDGYEIAKIFNACAKSDYASIREDAVISQVYKFAYVVNVKAGSSTMKTILREVLQRTKTYDTTNMENLISVDFGEIDIKSCHGPNERHRRYWRLSTKCAEMELYKNVSVFSFVRDPVAKFESGVRQAKAREQKYVKYNADEILDMVLNAPHDQWVNEHLEPSTYRLRTQSKNGSFLEYDFIGRLETFDHDWVQVVGMFDVSEDLRVNLTQNVKVKNVKEKDAGSTLSEEAILKMCKSERYRYEWSCFGYPLPDICRNHSLHIS